MMAESEPPFTQEIMRARYPSGFRLPSIEPYNGQMDLMEHVELYCSFMEVQGMSSAILCHAFPFTLSGAARRWFRRLRPNSISSFNELIREFTMHFRSARQREKLVTYLLTVKQHDGELLRKYIQRYNVETTQVDGYNDGVALSRLMEGLQNGRLWWSVAKNSLLTYS